MEKMKKDIERKIERNEKIIDGLRERHGDDPGNTHTYFGGWDLGYYEGMNSGLYYILDKYLED